MGHLRRGPDRQRTGSVLGDAAPRLDRATSGTVVDNPALDHDIGVGERLLDVAATHRPFVGRVRAQRLVDERVVLQRLLDVDDDGQRLVLDEHVLDGIHDDVLVVADDHRDGVADMADAAARQRPALGRLDLDARRRPRHRQRREQITHVLAGEDRADAGTLERGRTVDRDDPGVRLGRSHDRHVQHPGQDDVVDVCRAPRDQARILLAAQRLADRLHMHLLSRAHAATPRSASAAARTALTML